MKSRVVAVGLLCCLFFGSCGRVVESTDSGVIASGNMYEVIENNFIDGFEHSFTVDEIRVLNDILSDRVELLQDKINEDDIKYMLNLYGGDGSELYEYAIDSDFRIYDGSLGGIEVSCKELESFIESVVNNMQVQG